MRWVIYYGVITVVSIVVSVVFSSIAEFSLASAFPAIIMLSLLGEAWKETKEENFVRSILSARFEKDEYSGSFNANSPSYYYTKWDRLEERVFLFFAAIAIPFIFLFPMTVKLAASFAIFILPNVILTVFAVKDISVRIKYFKEEKKRAQRELEEQKRREEMGKWK